MIYIIFCNTEKNDILLLKNRVAKYCDDSEISYLIFEYPMDILDYLNSARPEKCAVFLETDNLDNGLEIADKIYQINPRYRYNLLCSDTGEVETLFYKGVTYYIRKPYEEESVERCTKHIVKFFNDQSGKTIVLKTKKESEAIVLSNIRYVMSDKRKVIFTLENREAEFYYKLDEVEKMLGESFLRCHQSYIINMKKIKMFVEDGVLLSDDTYIPVSRNKYYQSKRAYLSYLTGGRTI